MTKLYYCRCRCGCGVVLASGLKCAYCDENHIQGINPETNITLGDLQWERKLGTVKKYLIVISYQIVYGKHGNIF